ncbi:MAG: DUF4291 family protein [Planctomycetaceae bacterium]
MVNAPQQLGAKKGQERTLAIRIKRTGWEKALSLGVLTHPEPGIYESPEKWKTDFETAMVHVQWDTEKSLRGNPLNQFSIQVGLSRQIIQEFVDEWILEIRDLSPIVEKIYRSLKTGRAKQAQRLIPPEKEYQLPPKLGRKLMIC